MEVVMSRLGVLKQPGCTSPFLEMFLLPPLHYTVQKLQSGTNSARENNLISTLFTKSNNSNQRIDVYAFDFYE